MTPGLKWRLMILQIVLVVALASCSGFLFWASSFTQGYVHDELSAQKISFPAATSPALTALPAADAAAMKQDAGQPLDTGAKAQVYANHFIAVHLADIGMTYAQASSKAMASPTDTKLAGTVQTLFRGETLRGLLLNAWGWWTIGAYAFWAAIVLTVATLVTLGTLVFEVAFAPKRETAPAPAGGLRPSGARV
jgi:hypothetical protein